MTYNAHELRAWTARNRRTRWAYEQIKAEAAVPRHPKDVSSLQGKR